MRPLILLLLLPGCVTSEAEYVEAVRQRIARGPVAACCPDRDAPANCEATVRVRCAYVAGATATVESFQRLPHDSGAEIRTRIQGPLGKGSCTHQIYREGGAFTLGAGTCGPAEQ